MPEIALAEKLAENRFWVGAYFSFKIIGNHC